MAMARIFAILFDMLRRLISRMVTFFTKSEPKVPSREQLATLMKTRRSIMPYKFSEATICTKSIDTLLDCASWAPTHKLTQPWRFVVIEKNSHYKLHELTEQVYKKNWKASPQLSRKLEVLRNDAAHRWNNVSHFIAVCMKRTHQVPEWEEIAAVSCAVQNVLLMAPCQNIGCYWSSWHSEATKSKELLEFLGFDADNGDKCFGVLVLGTCNNYPILYETKRDPIRNGTKWM
jgi:nitroreductase